MRNLINILLLLGVSSAVTSETIPTKAWLEQDLSPLGIATEYYNKGSSEDSIYRALDRDAEYLLDESLSSPQIQFTIKETLCKKYEDQSLEKCPFKEDGMVKVCTATFFTGEVNVLVVTCDHVCVRKSKSNRKGSHDNGGPSGHRRVSSSGNLGGYLRKSRCHNSRGSNTNNGSQKGLE